MKRIKRYQDGGMATASDALTGLNLTNQTQPTDPFALPGAQQSPNVGDSSNVNVGASPANTDNAGNNTNIVGSNDNFIRGNAGTSQNASGYMYRHGGKVKAKTYKSGGMVSSASKRGDGCAIKGKTRGRMV